MKFYSFLFLILPSSSLAFQSAPTIRNPNVVASQAGSSLRCSPGDGSGDEASAITVAFTGEHEEKLRETISSHPLMSMIDASPDFISVACTDQKEDVTFFDETVDSFDIACFGSPETVKSWLNTLDHAGGVQDQTEEDRRAMGNGNVVAACIGSETARVCLETGRWQSHKIYYPKGDDNLQGWADCAAQAAADLIEERFWA